MRSQLTPTPAFAVFLSTAPKSNSKKWLSKQLGSVNLNTETQRAFAGGGALLAHLIVQDDTVMQTQDDAAFGHGIRSYAKNGLVKKWSQGLVDTMIDAGWVDAAQDEDQWAVRCWQPVPAQQ